MPQLTKHTKDAMQAAAHSSIFPRIPADSLDLDVSIFSQYPLHTSQYPQSFSAAGGLAQQFNGAANNALYIQGVEALGKE